MIDADLCGSSLDAAMVASRALETGDAEVVVAGGVESNGRCPVGPGQTDATFPAGNEELASTTLGWRLVNDRIPADLEGSEGGEMDKVVSSAAEAVAGIGSGCTLAVGGFGLCGIPSSLIEALLDAGVSDIEAVSNNAGVDDWGLGRLLVNRRLRRMVSSYVGENKEFARQYLAGELEVELTPQGTLAERMRAGGSGIAAFYTRTGVGTQVADGGLPWRYAPDGSVVKGSPAKPVKVFKTRDGDLEFVLEAAIVADFGLVRAWKGDRHGNLVYRDSARNFNPLAAMCGRVTIAEVEELVEPGEIHPAEVHTPGVFVQRVVALGAEQAAEKRIEKLTVRSRTGKEAPA